MALLLGMAGCGRISFESIDAAVPFPDGTDGSTSGWQYRRSVTVDPALVAGSADLSGFALLVSTTDPQLRTIAAGGLVAHPRGYDIGFTDADGVTPVPHQVERYDGSTGQLVAWVRVPVLSPGGAPPLYLHFGDPAILTSQEEPSALWDPSYVSVWHMDEPAWTGTTGEVRDATGRNSGTAVGGATTIAPGKIGGAGTFGPTDVNIDVGADASLQPASITVSAWANPQTVGSAPDRHPYMVRQDGWRADGLDPRGYYLEIYRTQTNPRPTFYTGNAAVSAHAFATTPVVNGTWYHVVGTRDATTGETCIYVNGIKEDTEVMTGGIAYLSSPVLIGGVSNETWGGLLDEVRISNVARSAEWILTEYRNQASPDTSVQLGSLETR